MTMSQTEQCIAAFDMTLTDLRAQGMDTVFILAALAEIAAKVARFNPEEGQAPLDAMIAVLDANAQAMRGGAAINMGQVIFGSRT
jgi:hypothetical protein